MPRPPLSDILRASELESRQSVLVGRAGEELILRASELESRQSRRNAAATALRHSARLRIGIKAKRPRRPCRGRVDSARLGIGIKAKQTECRGHRSPTFCAPQNWNQGKASSSAVPGKS